MLPVEFYFLDPLEISSSKTQIPLLDGTVLGFISVANIRECHMGYDYSLISKSNRRFPLFEDERGRLRASNLTTHLPFSLY